MINVFNPGDDKYNLTSHFGEDISQYKGQYRSLHIVKSRNTGCPLHLRTRFDGKNLKIKEL